VPVKILGLARLDAKLTRMPAAAKAEIKKAMEAAATEMVATMKHLVPVSSGPHGGTLRDSIGWTWGKAPKGAGIVALGTSKLAADLTLTVYAGNEEAFYGRWQEFGTVKQAAQPFFFVSYRAHRKSAKRMIRAATTRAAKKVAASS
jgi:HK97 gp10 family phage protein